MVSVNTVDDGQDSKAQGGHAVGHAAQDLVWVGHDQRGSHRPVVRESWLPLPKLFATPTLTFLFTDIEGSTSLLARLGEDAYAGVLADHHQLIRRGLSTHQGQEVNTQGDGFFAVFSSPLVCVAAVTEMQRALAAHHWPDGIAVRVRMGMHAGEGSHTTTGLVGYDVHRAARVAAVAHGGQVLLSSSAVESWYATPCLTGHRCGTSDCID
jgi:class 3 adenylate cyclase